MKRNTEYKEISTLEYLRIMVLRNPPAIFSQVKEYYQLFDKDLVDVAKDVSANCHERENDLFSGLDKILLDHAILRAELGLKFSKGLEFEEKTALALAVSIIQVGNTDPDIQRPHLDRNSGSKHSRKRTTSDGTEREFQSFTDS